MKSDKFILRRSKALSNCVPQEHTAELKREMGRTRAP